MNTSGLPRHIRITLYKKTSYLELKTCKFSHGSACGLCSKEKSPGPFTTPGPLCRLLNRCKQKAIGLTISRCSLDLPPSRFVLSPKIDLRALIALSFVLQKKAHTIAPWSNRVPVECLNVQFFWPTSSLKYLQNDMIEQTSQLGLRAVQTSFPKSSRFT